MATPSSRRWSAVPALNTTKALTSNADGDASGTVTQGDVLTYTVTVTNTGNIPLTNVVVTDSLITPTGGTTPCATVPVGGTCTLIGTYTVTAADVTTGSITNTGTGDSDQTPPDGDTLITPVVGSPALNTTKALTSECRWRCLRYRDPGRCADLHGDGDQHGQHPADQRHRDGQPDHADRWHDAMRHGRRGRQPAP